MSSIDQCNRTIEERLFLASIGGCTCAVKSPELQYHDNLCHYRIFEDASEIIRLKDGRMDDFRKRIKALEATLEAIWLQLDPGKSDIQDVPLARVNIGALVMRALPNKPEKASTI